MKIINSIVWKYRGVIKDIFRTKAEEFDKLGMRRLYDESYLLAIIHFDDAIDACPEYINAYVNRAEAYLLLNKFEKAIQDYSNVIRLDPDFAKINPYRKRGYCKLKTKDFIGAIEDYTVGMRDKNDKFDCYLNRGIAKYELNNYHEALNDFDDAILIGSNPSEIKNIGKYPLSTAYYCRAECRIMLKDFSGAIDDNTSAIQLNPSDYEYYFSRGEAKELMNDIEGAIIDFTKVISLNPINGHAYYLRGKLKLKLNKVDAAQIDFKYANKLGYSETSQLRP
jgi:tetratricopeptide (TPR) repeat protein